MLCSTVKKKAARGEEKLVLNAVASWLGMAGGVRQHRISEQYGQRVVNKIVSAGPRHTILVHGCRRLGNIES